MGFSRQERWSGLPVPSPGDLPDPGMKPRSPALQVNSLLLRHQGSPILKKSLTRKRAARLLCCGEKQKHTAGGGPPGAGPACPCPGSWWGWDGGPWAPERTQPWAAGRGRKGVCASARFAVSGASLKCRRKLLLTHLGANTRQDEPGPLFLCGHSLPLASLPPG